MKIGLGIVGLGYIGNTHLQHALRLRNSNLIAVADISKRALRNAREIGAKKTYADYRELLKDPEIDAVVISLPTHLHLECAKAAAEYKKHILLEKPIARDIKEAREIVSVTQANSVKIMMGYPLRFNRIFRNLREEITSGALGEVVTAYVTNISSGPFFHRAEGYAPVPVPDWWFKRDLTGGGVLVDLGSHMIDLLRWYFGEITDIRSRLGYRFNLDLEDSAICIAEFQTGTTAIVNVGWYSQEYKLKVEVHGSVKYAVGMQSASNPIFTAAQMLVTGKSKFFEPHLLELQYFIDCLMKDKNPSPNGNDGLKDIEAISLAYQHQMRS